MISLDPALFLFASLRKTSLDDGMSHTAVAKVPLIDDDTIRTCQMRVGPVTGTPEK